MTLTLLFLPLHFSEDKLAGVYSHLASQCFGFVYPQDSHPDLDTGVKLLGICLDEIKKADLSHSINPALESSLSDMKNYVLCQVNF